MKHLLLGLFLIGSISLQAQIEWLTFEEAVARNEREPKKILIDVYTDWCGWCKKMDKAVFASPAITAYISEHFYAVKFNAEQRAAIQYDGHQFVFDGASRAMSTTGPPGTVNAAVSMRSSTAANIVP